MFVLYLLVAFIVFFVCNIILYPIVLGKQRENRWLGGVDIEEFWLMIVIPVFWIVALLTVGLWKLLDTIYNKFN